MCCYKSRAVRTLYKHSNKFTFPLGLLEQLLFNFKTLQVLSQVFIHPSMPNSKSCGAQKSFFQNSSQRVDFQETESKQSFKHRVCPSHFREAPIKFTQGAFGHCPYSFCTPPRTQTGTLGHFFPGRFERLCQITVLRVYKCHKESWQVLNPLLTMENT